MKSIGGPAGTTPPSFNRANATNNIMGAIRGVSIENRVGILNSMMDALKNDGPAVKEMFADLIADHEKMKCWDVEVATGTRAKDDEYTALFKKLELGMKPLALSN